MSSDESDNYENDVDDETHKRLINNILSLNKKQDIKKPARTEPTLEVSEFNLVKSGTGSKGAVQLENLTKALKQRAGHVTISNKVKSVTNKAKTLQKPLEKPQAERIKRSVAYDAVRKQFDKWDPIVTSNRAADTLSFPLDFNTKLEDKVLARTPYRLKSDLMKKLEELEPPQEVYHVDMPFEENKPSLTLEEIEMKRKEAAKLRAHQSYKEAKARRQNKIKSKKYHKIQRKERLKKQMQEFEMLQKTNPEAALAKLEEIEKARAEERLTLRHKSTGKWARNKQIRAKYDKESRQALAEQLTISKELTQKMQTNSSSDSEPEEPESEIQAENQDEDNLWQKIKPTKEISDFNKSYKKFWLEKESKSKDSQISTNPEILQKPEDKQNSEEQQNLEDQEDYQTSEEEQNSNNRILTNPKNPENPQNIKTSKNLGNSPNLKTKKLGKSPNAKTCGNSKTSNIKLKNSKHMETEQNLNSPIQNMKTHADMQNSAACKKSKKRLLKNESESDLVAAKKAKTKQRISLNVSSTSDWEVSATNLEINEADDEYIENLLENLEPKLHKRIEEKYKQIAESLVEENNTKRKKSEKTKSKKKSKIDLALYKEVKRPQLDDELIEAPSSELRDKMEGVAQLKAILKSNNVKGSKSNGKNVNVKSDEQSKSNGDLNLNPKINLEPVKLNAELPDFITNGEEEEDDAQRCISMEAFEDDDIVDEFKKDKQDEVDKDNPKDVDLFLPGWGRWGGHNIDSNKVKSRKRFILKMPKKIPRRDDNKGNLVLSEKADDGLKGHMVNELPFPFKSVKDFEASVRAPIGNTFVPETAFKKLTKPAVTTKMGSIIEPISNDILLKKMKKR